jgi:hypothetical protein
METRAAIEVETAKPRFDLCHGEERLCCAAPDLLMSLTSRSRYPRVGHSSTAPVARTRDDQLPFPPGTPQPPLT